MKRFLIVTLIIAFLLTACSSNNNARIAEKDATTDNTTEETTSHEDVSTEPTDENQPEDSQAEDGKEQSGIEVDKNLLTVEVTYPASLIGDNKDEILNSKEDGIKEVRENADGSITFVMTKAKYSEMMEEAKKHTIDFLDSLPDSGDYPSIKKVTYNDDFSEIVLEVDKEAYQNSFDGFVTLSIGVTVGLYKVFDAKPDFTITMKIKDTNTGEIFNEVIFPDDFNQE